jgi:hypothetical protein
MPSTTAPRPALDEKAAWSRRRPESHRLDARADLASMKGRPAKGGDCHVCVLKWHAIDTSMKGRPIKDGNINSRATWIRAPYLPR